MKLDHAPFSTVKETSSHHPRVSITLTQLNNIWLSVSYGKAPNITAPMIQFVIDMTLKQIANTLLSQNEASIII